MPDALEFLVQTEGEVIRLCSPDVGLFTEAPGTGAALAPGQRAGTLLQLARSTALVVPAGVAGRVVSRTSSRVQAPVGHGDVLLELAPLGELQDAEDPTASDGHGALVLPSPQAGRFYRRPSPEDPPFVEPGAILEEGRVVGLIEVMKTFAHVTYQPTAGLPERARLVDWVAGDSSEVEAGAPLFEVEPA